MSRIASSPFVAVDLGNARELAATLETASTGSPIFVDLTVCSYLDSTGLSVFVRHDRLLRGCTAIVAPPDHRPLKTRYKGLACR